MIIFLRIENMGGEKKTNEDVNQVDEERNRRASIFLPLNPLKIYPVWLLSLSRS